MAGQETKNFALLRKKLLDQRPCSTQKIVRNRSATQKIGAVALSSLSGPTKAGTLQVVHNGAGQITTHALRRTKPALSSAQFRPFVFVPPFPSSLLVFFLAFFRARS